VIFAGIDDVVHDVITALGYPGLALLVAIENVFPPIPSELILPLAGFLITEGDFSFLPAVLWSTTGSVAGALVLYAIARSGGRRGVLRWGGVLRISEESLDRLDEGFRRRGVLYVAGARLIPGLRSAVSVPAGLARMPLGRFVALTTLGSATWNAALIGAGWLLGSQYERVGGVIGPISTVLVGLAVAALAVWLLRRRRRRPA
jgi:LPXTG-motif cell wall-anchored protein